MKRRKALGMIGGAFASAALIRPAARQGFLARIGFRALGSGDDDSVASVMCQNPLLCHDVEWGDDTDERSSRWASEVLEHQGSSILMTLHVTEIEIASSARNVILIGTSETPGSPGVGVYRSTDWGKTFSPIGPSANIRITDMTQAGSRVWVGTNTGLWYSDNASNESTPWFGVTWTQISGDPVLPVASIFNVVVSPWSNSVIYAAVQSGSDVGWYRSGNSGSSWTKMFTNFLDEQGQPLAAPAQIMNEAVIGEGATSGTDIIYTAMGPYTTQCADGSTNQQRLFRGVATSGGATWSRLGTPIQCQTAADCCDDLDCSCISGLCKPSPSCEIGNARTIAVHPDNSDHVVFGDELLWQSFDAGQTFIGLGRKAIYADKWAIEFDPSNPARVFVGTDGGIWRSSSDFSDPNVFATWSDEMNSNLANNLLTRSGNADIRNPLVSYTGSQDTGIFKGTKVGAWRRVIDFGDNGSVSVSPSSSNVVYTIDLGGQGMRHSLDGGGSYADVPNAPTPLAFGYVADKLVMDRSPGVDRHMVVYSMNMQFNQVFRASGVDTATPVWVSITANPPLPEMRSFDIVPSNSGGPSDFIIGGATDGDGVFRTINSGHTWTNHTSGLPTGGTVTKIIADDKGTCTSSSCVVYAVAGFDTATGRGAYRSTDAGVTWTNISRGSGVASGEELPDIEMGAMAIHPMCRNVIYVATFAGVYQGTLNDGRCSTPTDGLWHWARFDNGMPASPHVYDIRAYADAGVLRAYTWGRSAWEVRLYDPAVSLKVNSGSISNVQPESIQVSASKLGTRYYVGWVDDRAGANNWHFFVRPYETGPVLAPLAAEVQIDPPGSHVVQDPSVAGHPASITPYCGRFAWSDDRSGEFHVFAHYICSNGTGYGNDFTVDAADYPSGGNEGKNPSTTFNEGDKKFAVAWEREVTPAGTSHEIYIQFHGILALPEVTHCALGGGSNPCVVSNPLKSASDPVAESSLYDGDDNTFVVWAEDNAEIWIRKYGPGGTLLAGPVRVDAGGAFVQGIPELSVEDPSCVGGANAGDVCVDDTDCPGSNCGAPDVIVAWQRQFGFAPSRIMSRRFNYDLVAVGSPVAVGDPPTAPIGVERQRLPWVATDVENNVGFAWQGNVNGDATAQTAWNGFGLVRSPSDAVEDQDFLLDLSPRFSSAEDISFARGPTRKCFNIAWQDDRDGTTGVYTRVAYPPVLF